MKTKFSTTWKHSKQTRKQRKYLHNAPLHIKQKLQSTNLSKELRQKYGTRNTTVRKGDKVKILRGKFKGQETKVEELNLKTGKIYLTKIEITKKDGSKTRVPHRANNLQITELNLDDKRRKQKLLQNTQNSKSKTQKNEKTSTTSTKQTVTEGK
ncbi:50S ribosomal protein L24 [Candidatus Woesearchaeota archaeon]|nr:50S ribosomal protein L24 [Candidatus Woesearchaeota archaeon]